LSGSAGDDDDSDDSNEEDTDDDIDAIFAAVADTRWHTGYQYGRYERAVRIR